MGSPDRDYVGSDSCRVGPQCLSSVSTIKFGLVDSHPDSGMNRGVRIRVHRESVAGPCGELSLTVTRRDSQAGKKGVMARQLGTRESSGSRGRSTNARTILGMSSVQ